MYGDFLDFNIAVNEQKQCRLKDFTQHVGLVNVPALVYLLTYLLTPWSRDLEKLTGLQLVKKFPAFYGTRMFITALTSARHLSLS
jgi:hypothetical protein